MEPLPLYEQFEEIPESDHSSWGISLGKLAVLEELWAKQLKWAVVHRIVGAPWGNAFFVAHNDVWYQFSERADVVQLQPGDHPAVSVSKATPLQWAEGVRDFLVRRGEQCIAFPDGENAMIKSDSVPIMIEFLPAGN